MSVALYACPPSVHGVRRARLPSRCRVTAAARLLAAAGLAFVTARQAPAATLTYPGAFPCGDSLQNCIDGAQPGDRIEIAAPAPVDEDLTIRKSLTLAPARGTSPLIGGGPVTRTLSIQAGDGGINDVVDTITVGLSGLTLNNVTTAIDLLGGAEHRVEITDCRLTHAVNSSDAVGIQIDARVPSHVALQRNVVTTTGKPIRLFSSLADGVADFLLLGNVLTTSNPGLSSSGISIDHRGAGASRTDIHSNVIYNVGGCNCGQASGIDVFTGEAADATVNIINNTLDDAKAIQIRTPDFTSRLLVNVFNNIVTKATTDPVRFPNRSLNLVLNNGFNDLVKNKGVPGNFGGYLQGPGTFNLDPHYVGSGNYRLRSNSPVIDNGTAFPEGGLPSQDADGNERLARLNVDMGAYEYAAPRAGSTTTSTTTSSVTTITGSSFTTTTLPAQCAPLPTFDSIDCRLHGLAGVAAVAIAPGPTHDTVLEALVVATNAAAQARDLVTPGRNQSARAGLTRAMRSLMRFEARLRSRALKKALPASQRKSLRASSRGIRHDIDVLRRSLS